MSGAPRRSTRALGTLTRLGRPGALIGRELDLALSLGPRVAWRRLREAPGLGTAAADRLYRRIWEDAAATLGADVAELPGGFLEIRRGSAVTRVRNQLVALDDPITLAVAGDKPLVHELLARAGLPVPEHVAVRPDAVAEAEHFLDEHAPCVVKPASGSGRGDGITGNVRDRDGLLRARLRALRYDGARVLVERQVAGREYRVLVLDGEAVGVIRREPPHVVGNGTSDLLALVEAENRRRVEAGGAAGLWPIDLDLDALLTLETQGLGPRSVPEPGRRVRVRSGTSQCSEREATALPLDHPEVRRVVVAARAAAAAIGSAYAGVEIITPYPSAELVEAGGVVLEINTTPGLSQHYLADDPTAVAPVAATVLERLLVTGSRSS